MAKSAIIVQARMGSTRLPGKSMLALSDKPLIYRIIERLIRCTKSDDLILALPDTPENNIIEEVVKTFDIQIFRGSENNLIDRYYQAAIQHNVDQIIRFPADNIMPDPQIIDYLIDWHLENNREGFSSNLASVLDNGMIDGVGAEIFSFEKLNDALNRNPTIDQVEHVHLNFYDYRTKMIVDPEWCPVKAPPMDKKYIRSDIVLDINTLNDYTALYSVFKTLYSKNPHFSTDDILEILGET